MWTRRLMLAAGAGAALPAQGQPSGLLSPTTFFNPSNARIAEVFATIAFGGDAETAAPARPRLQRFRMPMRIGLIGDEAERYAAWVERHAAELARITRQPIAVVTEAPNVLVLLSPDPAAWLRTSPWRAALVRAFGTDAALEDFLGALTPRTGGLLAPAMRRDAPEEIGGAVIAIPTGRDPAMVWTAIVEELAQATGLLGDDPRSGWSIFSDQSPWCDLTDQDRWLLRLLYDRAIAPGMTPRAAQRAAAEAMRRLRPADVVAGPALPDLAASEAAVVEAFVTLAFASPGAAPGTRRDRLARWDAPVRLRVVADAEGVPWRHWVGEQAGHLAFLTRHVVELVTEGEANLVLLLARDPARLLAEPGTRQVLEAAFGPLDEMEHALPRMASVPAWRVTAFADAARTRPRAAIAVVRADQAPPRIWAGIVEMTAAALGQFGRVATPVDSCLSDATPHLDLTPLDQRLLRLLYLGALRPGQTRAEARAAALSAVGLSAVAP
jgi:hypothetical protein